MQIIAGDIGGTNTRLICANICGSDQTIRAEMIYPSTDYSGLIQILDVFLEEHGIQRPIDAACFAIAGPVESDIAKVTNLPWLISKKELKTNLNTPRVKIINDFVAVAYGISDLKSADTMILQHGLSSDTKSVHFDSAIIGAGTGFGASHRVWLNDRYMIFPSEAGHVGFAPENSEQNALLAWLQKKHSHVCLEMLLSGRGLINIYQFLKEAAGFTESLSIREDMQKTDPAQVISEHALKDDDVLCQKTLEIFIDIYGAAAGNVALHFYPVHALYIAGGIAPKIKNKMGDQRFIRAFLNKGIMSTNMRKIDIRLITQDRVGLYGALSYARTSLSHATPIT